MYSKGLHETTKKEMSKWQKEVFIMPADLQSESNLIHSHTAPKRALCGADVQHRTRTRSCPQSRYLARLWGCGAARAVQLNTGE